MNLVDSSGWLEYLTDGRNAEIFSPVIENSSTLIVSVINVYEVYKKVLIERGEDYANKVIEVMQQVKIIDITYSISIKAANISYKHKMPMADSLIYATGIEYNSTIWTQDADFKGLKGVKYFKK